MSLLLGLERIADVPAHMTWPEKVALYALVRGIRPQRVLEIGTLFGGSASVIVQAMDDAGCGALFCLDPNPQVSPGIWNRIKHRATLYKARSPDALSQIYSDAGGPFDLAFIDGDHETEPLKRDIAGVVNVIRPGGLMIFHDAHFGPVEAGIDQAIASFGDVLWDMGLIVDGPVTDQGNPDVFWGGLRVVRRGL
jgi:predicted O-methyltransferase YrrM